MRAATFTTYINAQTDPGLEQAFTRQAQIATSSYATITRAAEQATRATAGLLGARGTQGAGVGNAQTQQRAAALRSTATAAAEAERASIRLATATRREAAEAASAARQHAGLARNLATTSTALNLVSGRLDPVASRLNTLTRAVTDLTGVQLGLAAFGATLFALGRTANGYANLTTRLRPFFASQKDANGAMQDIIGIAERSRTALEPVVEIYTRLISQTDALGLSQGRIGRLTEVASKAATLSGGTTQAREGALVQFSQALGANFRGSGQEFNSLQEGAPLLLKAIADGYKDMNGQIGISTARLRQLASEGKVTSVQVADALDRSSVRINALFANLPKTLSSASTEFSNALTVTIGKLDQAAGFTSTLAEGLSIIARNLRVILALAAGVATTFALFKVGALVTEGAAAVRTFLTMRAAVEQLGIRRQANAAASLAQHQREVAALAAEGAEIRANIALLERQRAVAARDVARYQPGPGYAGSARLASKAAEEESRAVRGLIQERQRLGIIQAAGSAANVRVAASTTTLATATANVTSRVGLFRTAASSLLSFLGGPWGVVFAVATTAVYLLATAQSAAEIATKKAEDAQRSYAGSVDRATGKVYDQIGALQKLSLSRKLGDSGEASFKQFRSTGSQIVSQIAPLLGSAGRPEYRTVNGFRVLTQGRDTRTEEQRRLAEAVDSFRRGERSSVPRLQALLADQRIQRGVPGLSGRAASLGSLFDNLSQRANEVGQAGAARRVLAGTARAGDLARSLGEETRTTNGGVVKPTRTRAQIEAAAAAESASTDVERARAALKGLRAQIDGKTGLLPGRDDVQTQHELASAMQAVTQAVNAQKASRASAATGRAAERKAARDATQDALDEAKAKRDAALLELNQKGLNPKSNEFLQARIAILTTYDQEVNKIDASRAASSSAAAQAIADAAKVSAAAQAAGEKRRDILASYDDAPRARDRANDQIDDLQRFVDTAVDGVAFIGKTKAEIEDIKRINPLGTGIYTQDMADADARRIEDGVRKPLRDMQRDIERNDEIVRLQLQGRDAEANALQRKNQLLDAGVDAADIEFGALVRNEQQQLRINDALAARQRVVSTITGALDSARDTTEQILTGLQTGANPGDLFKSALAEFRTQFARINSRTLVEQLFAGSDEKLRALLQGKSSVDTAIGRFGTSVDTLTTKTARVETAADRFATAAENAAARLNGISAGGITGAGAPASGVEGAAAAVAPTLIQLLAKGNGVTGPTPSGESTGDIVVTGQRRQATSIPLPTSVTPSARAVYSTIGSSIGQGLDKIVDKVRGTKTSTAEDGTKIGGSTFFKKIGDSFGTALEGAGQGAIASGFAKALGIKQSSTGAAIGGAIGNFLPIPGGGFIGGLVGGTIGGLFQKTPKGQAGISVDQYGIAAGGAASGTTSSARAAASSLAGSVASGIQQIADTLGAQVTGTTDVQIGTYKDLIRVNDHGGAIGGVKGSGAITFASEEAAINYAIQDAIKDGVLSGITAASQRILASGQDLQRALAKATAIEAIPKRLLAIENPVKYAVVSLNDEFTKLISYLKEGGATAEQYADAQKLYDLQRVEAVKQATQQAGDQIEQYLKEMVGGSSSPLNKKTIYENAAADLEAFKKDIAAGKSVDQGELLSAARNFQDASRSINGSSQSFFDDFEMLRSLLAKARDNVGMTDVSTLPASPFANDSTVQAAIASLKNAGVDATKEQTDVLGGKLDALTAAVVSLGDNGGGGGSYGGDSSNGVMQSSIGLLPAWQ